MTKTLECIHDFIWGMPALIGILGVGLYLSIRTGWAQITLFPQALRRFIRSLSAKSREDGTSSFQALCTALAATVGTGNLVGVAGAICIGGPGSIFWMWLCGLLAMITKYAEVTLAVRYRRYRNGEYVGGPMYLILVGMGKSWHPLAYCYSLFGILASFGVGNATQIHALIAGMNSTIRFFGGQTSYSGNLILGILLALLIGAMLTGGAVRIGKTAEKLVPAASVGYVLLCIGVLIQRWDAIPSAFAAILQGAFSPKAVTGGMLGSAFRALSVGCSRGVFTNEAGMGTASIAHASAAVRHPAEQGLMGIMEVFLDTILICTLTALVILCSGEPIPYGFDAGGELTFGAFSRVYGQWVNVVLTAALVCFAFATVLGWGLYGARCAQFLLKKDCWRGFALAQMITAFFASVMNTGTIWLLAETLNGLMAIPNLIALAYLSPELVRLTKEYKKTGHRPAEVYYADFHQRKPL